MELNSELIILWMVAQSISHHFETLLKPLLVGIFRGIISGVKWISQPSTVHLLIFQEDKTNGWVILIDGPLGLLGATKRKP